MNKIILLSAIAISIASVSCKKERTCECTNTDTTVTTYNNGTSSSNTNVNTTKTTAAKQTKKYFRTHQTCYSYTEKQTQSQGNYTSETTNTADCTLK